MNLCIFHNSKPIALVARRWVNYGTPYIVKETSLIFHSNTPHRWQLRWLWCDTGGVEFLSRAAIGNVPMAGTCVANNSGQLSAAVRKYTKAVGSRSAALKAPPALHLLSSTSSSVTLPLLPTTSVISGSQVNTNQQLLISRDYWFACLYVSS